jgi:hypothetical protein
VDGYEMRDGTTVADRRLGRLVQFDQRSRNWPIRTLLAEAGAKPRGYSWRMEYPEDQLQTSRCVGFSISQEISARPVVVPPPPFVDGEPGRANTIYSRAQFLDEWPGEGYDGTSVLAGAKAATEMGFYTEYRWAFGLDDLILAVGYHGPAVLGINWKNDMFEPDGNYQIHATGGDAGGHAILCRSVSVKRKLFFLHNSWGEWGFNGGAWISFDDMEMLLHEDGEACIPVRRLKGEHSG